MGISSLFKKAAVTATKAMGDVTKSATYVEVVDNGFDPKTENNFPCRIIYSSFTEGDIRVLKFGNKIKSTDVKGLVPYLTINKKISSDGILKTDDGLEYNIVDLDIDAAGALYILLLRK